MCSLEALAIAAAWRTTAPISQTPLYAYSLVLLLDFLVYSLIALALVDYTHRTRTPSVTNRKTAKARSWLSSQMYSFFFSTATSSNGGGGDSAVGSVQVGASLLIDRVDTGNGCGRVGAHAGSAVNGDGGVFEAIVRTYRTVAWMAHHWMLSPMVTQRTRASPPYLLLPSQCPLLPPFCPLLSHGLKGEHHI